MAIARARGKLRGKPPKLSPAQTREVHRMHASGDYAIAQIAELFSVSRPTIYRSLQRTTDGELPAGTRPPPDVAKYDALPN
jgi:DNA invertase Pin-like site-specific DNA recombinase